MFSAQLCWVRFLLFIKRHSHGCVETKDLTKTGSKLTNINFLSLINQTKFVYTLRCKQQSLAQLACTITPNIKASVKNLNRQFLCSHNCFREVWFTLDIFTCEKVLELIASGRCIMPYKKITDVNSLKPKPEHGIFFKKIRTFQQIKTDACEG